MTDEEIARIATAVVDELERRGREAAQAAATRLADGLRAIAAARQQAHAAARVEPQRHVFVDRGEGAGFERVEVTGAVRRDPTTQAIVADALEVAGVCYVHVGDRSGPNPDGSPYAVRCYRAVPA